MVSILEKVSEYGASIALLCFILVLLLIINFDEIVKKVKKTFKWVDIDEIKEKEFLERIEALEKRIDDVDKKVDDTSGLYNTKLDGFHQESIKIRGDLADDILAVKGTQNDIKESILDLKHIVIDDKIDTIRWEILDFSSRLATNPNAKYSKEQFDHVFEIYVKYETIIENEGLSNGMVDMSMAFIKKKYAEFMENGFN